MESAKDCSRLNVQFIEDDVMSDVYDDETCKRDRLIYADEIPVEEECLEIQDSSEEICLTFKSEPMDGLISPIPSFDDHLKSPFNSISDCGYESVGSPASVQDFSIVERQDDLNYLLNDLFPSLA
jgi:hypothetical protein